MNRIRRLPIHIITCICELNWFKSSRSTMDDRIRHTEIITTRIYILLFAACMCGILLITAVPEARIEIRINRPSFTDYRRLQAEEDTLRCSCSTISIPYSNFVLLPLPTFHQICSSPFISQSWISAVFNRTTINRLTPQPSLGAHFQLLASFCHSSQKILSSGLETLRANQFVSVTLQSSAALVEQMNSTITQFYTQTSNSFSLSLAFILNTTLSNQVASVYQSNWRYVPGFQWSLATKPQYYGRYLADFIP